MWVESDETTYRDIPNYPWRDHEHMIDDCYPGFERVMWIERLVSKEADARARQPKPTIPPTEETYRRALARSADLKAHGGDGQQPQPIHEQLIAAKQECKSFRSMVAKLAEQSHPEHQFTYDLTMLAHVFDKGLPGEEIAAEYEFNGRWQSPVQLRAGDHLYVPELEDVQIERVVRRSDGSAHVELEDRSIQNDRTGCCSAALRRILDSDFFQTITPDPPPSI